MSVTYTPLHVHSMYSLLDGFSTPEEYFKRCEELGINSMAITEHGNQLSWLYFAKLNDKYPNIKMLYGVEMYETEDLTVQDKDSKYYHLVVIARNERGRKALNKLVTISNIEGFYYKPRITINHMKEYADDLIVLSACLASKIARESNFDKSLEYVKEYKSIFPYFYLEMQSHKTEDQEIYNQKILKLSELTNTPYVITTDAHSATEEELKYQGYHVQIAQDRETMGETYSGCYIQSVEEIHEIMDSQIGSDKVKIGLEETNKIADLCEVVKMPFQKPKLPHYELPEGFESNKEFIRHLCEIGWKNRKIDSMTEDDIQIRKDRMEYELSVINQMDFDGYFIILWDALEYARTQNVIIGAGRGSAAGSLVCYLLNITDIDPIKYDLIFERFLNPERVSYPDVDVDTNNRELIINYLMGKYGENKVCQVLNFSYITPVVAIKDVASKIFKIPYNIANNISKRFNYATFKECIDNNPNIYNEYPEYKEWFDIAEKLSGKIRHCSVHAGGVGIVDGDMEDYIGLRLGSDGSHVIQADKRVVEEIGIVKYDLLGVKTLNIVEEARKDAGLSNWDLNINNPKFENDEKSYELMGSGNTDLVFQMESSGMKELAVKSKPKSMEDLSAVIALYRPDSMPFIPDYLRGKTDRKSIEYIHPDMEYVLNNTYGALVYQEQILEIVRKFGGRSYGGADIFRKAVGKKDKELIETETEKLKDEIVSNKYNIETASNISKILSEMGGYCFNKCLHYETRVFLEDGKSITVKDLYKLWQTNKKIKILSMFEDGSVKPHVVKDVMYSGKKECFQIKTKKGRQIKLTKDHRLLTNFGYGTIADGKLCVGATLIDDVYKWRVSEEVIKTRQETCRQVGLTQSDELKQRTSERMKAYQKTLVYEDRCNHQQAIQKKHPNRNENGLKASRKKIQQIIKENPNYYKEINKKNRDKRLKECGYIFGNKTKLPDGRLCDSVMEYDCAMYLLDKGVDFELHKQFISINGDKRWCDFYVDGLYFEFDGLRRGREYFESKKYGKEIPFVYLTPETYREVIDKILYEHHIENGDEIVEIIESPNFYPYALKSDTYDIEMASEPHNFIANGLVSHNSHSLSYSVLCLQTAYLKAHYPLQFYKASFNVIDKSTLSRYIVDANRNGIKIVPPNINKSDIGFSIQDGKIMFGLSSIKGLGEVVAQAIIDERNANGKFSSLDDFIKRCNVSDSLIVTLTKAGALPVKNKKEFLLRYINNQYEFNYKPVKTLPTLEKLENEWRIDLEKYPTKDDRLTIYNEKKEDVEKAKFEVKKQKGIQEFIDKYMQDEDLWEFETLSTFITNNPFESIYKSGLVRPVEEIDDEGNGVLVGVVSKIQKKKDKNKNQFAYVEMFSAYGTYELICWAKQFKTFEPLLKKNNKLAFFYKKKDDKLITVQVKSYDQWEIDNKLV